MGVEIFFSYSQSDEDMKEQLEKHLSILKRQGVIATWNDRQITAGSERAGEIDSHLNSAQIIVLLISSDFMASDHCFDIEMKRALERHEAGDALVIPVILRPFDLYNTPFGKLQALPKDAKPISMWKNQDQAFSNVAQEIRKAIEARESSFVESSDSESFKSSSLPSQFELVNRDAKLESKVVTFAEKEVPPKNRDDQLIQELHALNEIEESLIDSKDAVLADEELRQWKKRVTSLSGRDELYDIQPDQNQKSPYNQTRNVIKKSRRFVESLLGVHHGSESL